MKKMKGKRLLALALAAAMILALAACSKKPTDSGTGGQGEIPEGKLFPEGTVISMAIGSHASWPYNENWPIWKYFQEAVGAKFEIQAIPNESFETKIPLMMASPETLPDMLHATNKSSIDSHALDGAFVSISDNESKMPNYKKFLESLSEDEREELLMQRKSGDGKIYFPPVYGTQTVTNLRTWMYRKDIFEKNNLQVPTTLNEVYEVSKKLKELYPDSYPLCFRTGLTQIDVMGPMWKNDFSYAMYYDFQTEKWAYGAAEDTMKDVISFFHQDGTTKNWFRRTS